MAAFHDTKKPIIGIKRNAPILLEADIESTANDAIKIAKRDLLLSLLLLILFYLKINI